MSRRYGAAKPLIIEAISKGMTVPQVVKTYGIPRATVYKTATLFNLPINRAYKLRSK